MKKLLILSIIALGLLSCKSDEPTAFQIKATDMISIKPAAGASNAPMKVKSDNETHLSALDIVKQTSDVALTLYWGELGTRSFIDDQKDTISATPKLLMWATDVIMLDGELQEEWITAVDVVFRHYPITNSPELTDTIAYIPNATLRAAEIAIRAAYEAKDIEECYRLFNEAYTFTPITGTEWRALKANNEN